MLNSCQRSKTDVCSVGWPIFLSSTELWITVFYVCLLMGGVQHFVVVWFDSILFCSALYLQYNVFLWRWIHRKMWLGTVVWSGLSILVWLVKVEISRCWCEVGLIIMMVIMSIKIMIRMMTSDKSDGWMMTKIKMKSWKIHTEFSDLNRSQVIIPAHAFQCEQ